MPDRWGRLTLNDGLSVARTAQYFKHENERDVDRRTEEDSYKVADALKNKGDISGFDPKAQSMGSRLYWDDEYSKIRTQTAEQQKTNGAMQEKMNRLNLNMAEANEKRRVYQSARRSGNDALAKQLAVDLSNKNMYNGRHIEGPERGEPGYKVTNWDGSVEKINDMPMEQIDQLIGAYFDKSPDEIMQWQIGAEQMRSQKNAELLSNAEPWINEKTGQVIYKVPAGVWGPDGKPKGSFFVDSPMAETELPKDKAKGFVRLDIAGSKANLKGKGLSNQGAVLSNQQAKKNLNKPDIISPDSIVTQGGQAGLLVGNQDRGAKQIDEVENIDQAGPDQGPVKFQPIEGGLDTGKGQGQPSAGDSQKQYNLYVKQLETQLMPFVEKGTSAIDPDTLQITNSGKNALRNAMQLATKAQQDPNSLTPEERQLAGNAMQAVQIYQAISQLNAQSFGLPGQGAAQNKDPDNIRDLLFK